MNPAHQLLLLNPKSQSWSPVSGFSTSHSQKLRWEDVASALSLGKLSPLAYYLIRAKYCQDETCIEQLLPLVQKEATRLAREEKWRTGGDWLLKLSRLACLEALDSMLCKRCSGRGYNLIGKACPTCRSYGRKPMSARGRYQSIGMDKRNWERRWDGRYERLYQVLCNAENKALAHLNYQLNSE